MIKFEANFGADDHISSINKIRKIRGTQWHKFNMKRLFYPFAFLLQGKKLHDSLTKLKQGVRIEYSDQQRAVVRDAIVHHSPILETSCKIDAYRLCRSCDCTPNLWK